MKMRLKNKQDNLSISKCDIVVIVCQLSCVSTLCVKNVFTLLHP